MGRSTTNAQLATPGSYFCLSLNLLQHLHRLQDLPGPNIDTKEMSPQPVQLTGRLVLRQQLLLRRRQSHLAIIRTRQYVHLSFDACLEVSVLIFNINEVESEYCVCQGSVTLPVLSASPGALNHPTKRYIPPWIYISWTFTKGPLLSCDYVSLPDAKARITTTASSEPLTINSARCEVCSVAGKNNQECTTMPNCLPQTPKAWVEVGNSAVHVETLTSMALSSSISSALASICPEVTQTASMTNCTDQTVKIDGIWYKDPEDDELNKAGQLEVKVTVGQHNATSLRNAMINSAALTAMQSATGGNCYTEH